MAENLFGKPLEYADVLRYIANNKDTSRELFDQMVDLLSKNFGKPRLYHLVKKEDVPWLEVLEPKVHICGDVEPSKAKKSEEADEQSRLALIPRKTAWTTPLPISSTTAVVEPKHLDLPPIVLPDVPRNSEWAIVKGRQTHHSSEQPKVQTITLGGYEAQQLFLGLDKTNGDRLVLRLYWLTSTGTRFWSLNRLAGGSSEILYVSCSQNPHPLAMRKLEDVTSKTTRKDLLDKWSCDKTDHASYRCTREFLDFLKEFN
jgi:hypothetical protein